MEIARKNMQTIYEPKGKAREYSPLALNLYDGCDHGCKYCYVPKIKQRFKPAYDHESVRPRSNIIENLKTIHSILPKEKLFIPDQIWGRNVPENIATTITSWSLPMCPNASEEIMIAYDGTVHPCCMFNPYTFGNLHETSLKEIWKSPQRIKFLETYRENYYCQKCEYMIHK